MKILSLSQRCGRTLLFIEAAGGRVCVCKARAGLPVVVANPTMPVGPGDRGLSPPTRLILDFCARRLPAIMDCTLNVIDVRDVACGLVMVMEQRPPGRRYLLGNANLTLRELCERLRDLTGVPPPRFKVAYPIRAAGGVDQRAGCRSLDGTSPQSDRDRGPSGATALALRCHSHAFRARVAAAPHLQLARQRRRVAPHRRPSHQTDVTRVRRRPARTGSSEKMEFVTTAF